MTQSHENRRAPRRETRSDAVAALGAQTQFTCTILDINAFGARIEFGDDPPPASFYLIDVVASIAYRAQVVWRRAPQVGTRFVETWELASDSTPAWLKEVRGEALQARARDRGIELIWSSPTD